MQKPDVLFVHITDLHIKDEKSASLTRAKELANAIGSVREVDSHLVLILSGDVAFGGSEAQYALTSAFLQQVTSALQAWTWHSVTILSAPGNHDNDYSSTDDFTRQSLLSQARRHDEDEHRAIESLNCVQKRFTEFRDTVYPHYEVRGALQATAKLCFEGDVVVVDLFNSAWSSVLDEKPGQLMLPTGTLTSPDFDCELAFAAIHHPPNWFQPADQRKLVDWLDQRYEIVFWGHEHESDEVDRIRRKSGASVKFVIGNAFDPPPSENSTPGFGCFQWNRRDGDFREVTFHWTGDRFSNVEDVWLGSVPRNHARATGSIRVTPAFTKLLDDPGVAFTHPHVNRQLLLSDIFVYPEFRKVDGSKMNQPRLDSDHQGAEFIDYLLSRPKSVIVGPEQSGKTSFSKVLFAMAARKGKRPLYLDGQQLKSSNRGEIKAWMRAAETEQYESDCLDEFSQLAPSQRIIILDNAHLLPAGSDGANQVVAMISGHAETLAIFSSQSPAVAIISAEQAKVSSEPFWKGAEVYDLLPLSHIRRSDLIRKWVALGREGRISLEEIEAEVRGHKSSLDQVLGRNFLPKFPLFVLILLQQFEAFRGSRAIIANGSHGYLFEALIIDSCEKHVRSFSIGTVFSYLALLARQLADSESRYISTVEHARFHTKFLTIKLVEMDRDLLLSELVNAHVLQRTSVGISFRYQYLYYYFLAKEFSLSSQTEETKAHVQNLVDLVHTEQSASVLTFLAHLGGEADVVPRLLTKARSVYSDTEPCKLEDFSGLLMRFRSVQDRAILLEGGARELSDHHSLREDELESHQAKTDAANEGSGDDPLHFNTALKLIQVMGQVLRSQAGRADGDVLVEIASCCLGLARRTIGSMYAIIESAPEALVREASETFEKHLSFDKVKANDIANRFLAFIVLAVATACTAKAAEAIGAAELLPVIEALEAQTPDLTQRLLLTAARLSGERDFADRQVRALVKELMPNRILPLTVLGHLVTRRFFLRPPDRHTKQAFCALLNIETRKLTLNQSGR